jgi:regulatory protein
MAKKYISRDEALRQMQRYCAYQDRCHLEARRKLLDLGIFGQDLEEILLALIEDKFLDEERFARSFARGKFQIKGWGRIRITAELKQRQISSYCLRKAMEEIDPEAYLQKLEQQLRTRAEQYNNDPSNPFEIRQRLAQYGIRKGFEPEVVWETLKKMLLL